MVEFAARHKMSRAGILLFTAIKKKFCLEVREANH